MNTKTMTNLRILLKHNRLLWIAALLLLALGLWVNIKWFPYHPTLTLFFVNFLPGILLLIFWYSTAKADMKPWVVASLGVVMTSACLLLAVFINVSAGVVLATTTPINDVARYEEIRNSIENSDLIEHFPETIPNDAQVLGFEYFRGFMQGGAYIQLRLQLPPDEIAELSEQFHTRAKYRFVGGNSNDHTNQPNDIPTTFFHTSGTDDISFPYTYEILMLDAQPTGTPDFEWNHGFSYGVAISITDSEIVYWAEDW
jgi:hypothetical protein